MPKLIVEIPEQLHQELKKRAAARKRTLKEMVTRLLEDHLRGEGEADDDQAGETGLCGAWQDERSADTIIADIRDHRKWFRQSGP